MRMLLEKTIFRVDVLWLTVRLDGSSALAVRRIAEDRETSDEAEEAVARVAVDATCADAQLEFVRNVSADRFFGAIRESSRHAREAGFIEAATYALIDESLPTWYGFLVDRGVREGDRMSYHIRGDTLNVQYQTAGGEVLLDQTDVGAERRRSVLGGYFSPGSDFRKGLIESLFREVRTSTVSNEAQAK